MLDLLGEGAFGKVRLAVDETSGKEYAMKIMDKSHIKANELTLQVRREIAVMKAMRHRKFFASHNRKKGKKKKADTSYRILSSAMFRKLRELTLSVFMLHCISLSLLSALAFVELAFCTLRPHQRILSTSMKSSHPRRTSTWSWTWSPAVSSLML